MAKTTNTNPVDQTAQVVGKAVTERLSTQLTGVHSTFSLLLDEIKTNNKISNGLTLGQLKYEKDIDKDIKREAIPKCVRNALWINFFKNQREGLCQCCKREKISIGNFHAGHIKAHINGGSSSLDNLVPICMLCNTSMGKYDLNEFITKYNLRYGLDEL